MRNRLGKEAASKAVKRHLQEQAAAALVGPVQQFIESSDDTLRLARITKVYNKNTFNIKFSENGEEMQGRYTGRKKNLTRKQKTAGRKLESELLPQVDNYVIVQWDEKAAKNNSARAGLNNHKDAAANIVAIIPQTEKKIESMVIKVANHAAKVAGNAKPWGLEDPSGLGNIFLRDEADEEALEREQKRVANHKAEKARKAKELQEAKAARMSESARKVIAAELEGKKKKTRKNMHSND